MERFLIQEDNYELKLYYKDIETAKQRNPNAESIEEYFDDSYMKYIDDIKNAAEFIGYRKNRERYRIDLSVGFVIVELAKDPGDDLYYDYCEYILYESSRLVEPITRTMSTPYEFANMFLIEPMEYIVYSSRKYGEPKLSKPKELKGIKSTSVDFIPKKCKCEYFVKDDDIWLKHRDFFSPSYCRPEDIGTPLTYRIKKYGIQTAKKDKFIYADTWGDIVLRSEAWLVFKNAIPNLKCSDIFSVRDEIIKQICKHHHIDDLDFY